MRTCWCPPWRLRDGMRRPWRWLPFAALRWYHHVTHWNCTPKWMAEKEELVDWRGRYQFRDRLTFSAYATAKRYEALYWELKREIHEMRQEAKHESK